MSASSSNQKSAIRVRIAPLPGTGAGKMRSKALMRSVATIRMRSAPTA
jgi:hypothetical protein